MVSMLLGMRLLFLLALATLTNGQCSGVNVNYASYQSQINGYYYLSVSALCNGANIWIKKTSGSEYTYISVSSTRNWVIASRMCPTISSGNPKPYANNTTPTSYYKYPYDLPYTWQEYDGSRYVNNYALYISCTTDDWYWTLTTGGIIGIVIGSICFVIMIFAIIACICAKHKANKHAAVAEAVPPLPPTSVVFTTNGSGAVTNAYMLEPPAYYSEIAPPAYTFSESTGTKDSTATTVTITSSPA